MKSKLKAPGTERLKLKYDNLVLRCAFKFNLRCYNMAKLEIDLVGQCRLNLSNPR